MGLEFYDLKVRDINKNLVKMSDFKNKVLLLVVMSSDMTRFDQLTILEQLYNRYSNNCLEILLFPTDQFNEFESLSSDNLNHALHDSLSIDLPLMEKVDVKGDTKHPLFQYLTEGKFKMFKNEIKRNFTMFVVSKTGEIAKRINHDVSYDTLQKIIDPYIQETNS